MTGISWVDTAVCTAFVVVTVLTLVRLALGRSLDRFLDDAFHSVMGLAMIAMFWPDTEGSSARVWIAVIGLIVVWPLVVLALATRRSAATSDQISTRRSRLGHFSVGHTGYWFAGTLVMIVAVGAGHHRNTDLGPLPAGNSITAGHSMSAGNSMAAGNSMIAGHSGALGDALQAVAGWPIWPLVALGFGIYAGLLLLGPTLLPSFRRPITERICAAVMAAGMAAMAFSL
ncbi:MAG TPA: DUF5134 domain-containing protein [Kineosporiaceae bacterium]|nr:DUF5134 domain-containing protein [Kineosporiaceae bacterium]